MTDDIVESEGSRMMSSGQNDHFGRSPDPLLQGLAPILAPVHISLMVMIGGTMVVGRIMPEDDYFQLMDGRFRAKFANLPEGPILQRFANQDEGGADNTATEDDGEGEGGTLPPTSGYLHLKDCRIFVPGADVFTSELLRIRLAEVQAWTFSSSIQE